MISNAEIRLAIHSFVTNKIKRSGVQRQGRFSNGDNEILSTLKELQGYVDRPTKRLKLLKTLPGKLSFMTIKTDMNRVTCYMLVRDGKVIAFVTLIDKHIHLLFVVPEAAGGGIGLKLFDAVLAQEGVLRSSTNLSQGATRLWQKMATKHKGQLFVPVSGSKTVAVNIVGWETVDGYVYPMVMKSGTKVSLHTLLKSKGFQEQLSAEKSYFVVRL